MGTRCIEQGCCLLALEATHPVQRPFEFRKPFGPPMRDLGGQERGPFPLGAPQLPALSAMVSNGFAAPVVPDVGETATSAEHWS